MSVTRPGPHRKGRRGGVSPAARWPRRGDTLELLRTSTTLLKRTNFKIWPVWPRRDLSFISQMKIVLKPTAQISFVDAIAKMNHKWCAHEIYNVCTHVLKLQWPFVTEYAIVLTWCIPTNCRLFALTVHKAYIDVYIKKEVNVTC